MGCDFLVIPVCRHHFLYSVQFWHCSRYAVTVQHLLAFVLRLYRTSPASVVFITFSTKGLTLLLTVCDDAVLAVHSRVHYLEIWS